MFIEDEDINLLKDIGFTKTQAKVYMLLLRFEGTDGRTLSEKTGIPRQEVYRTLGELEKKGLVERIISTPFTFKATSFHVGLRILMSQKAQQFQIIKKKTESLLRKHKHNEKEAFSKQQYKLSLIQGRQRLIYLMKLQHDNVQQTVDILTTFPRWLQITHFCFNALDKATDRGVEYRVVIDMETSEAISDENIQLLLQKQSFNLRLCRGLLKTNSALFDKKEATVNFYPSQSLAESPLIWTNHPSLISMCQDHFEAIWKASTPIKRTPT